MALSSDLPFVSLVAVAVLLLSAVRAGTGLLDRVVVATTPPDARPHIGAVERALLGVVLGIGVQGTLLLGLAALGWMQTWALWCAVVAPALIPFGTPLAPGSVRASAAQFVRALTRVERIGAGAVFAVAAGILVIAALAPVTDWDSQMYHLRLPQQFLAAGRLHLPDDGLHIAYLGLFQFLYLPLLAIGSETAPALLNAALTLTLGIAVGVVANHHFGRGAALLAAIGIWGSSSWLFVGSTARVDAVLPLVLLLAHHTAMRTSEHDGRWAISVTAVLAGIAIAFKYHGLAYAAALIPVVLVGAVRAGGARAAIRTLVPAALTTVGVAAPWLLKNAMLLGAPLYPFFAQPIVPPFIAELIGSRAHPATVSLAIYDLIWSASESTSLPGLLFRSAALGIESEGALYTRNLLAFAAPLSLLWVRDRRVLAVLVPAALYLAMLILPFERTNLRFLMPALPALVILGGVALARLAGLRGEPTRLARTLLVILAALATVPALDAARGRLITPHRTRVALGMRPPSDVLRWHLPAILGAWMRDSLPADARVLLLFDARGFRLPPGTLQDNVLTNWPLLAATGAPERCLAGTGITHVAVHHAQLDYYLARGMNPGVLALPQLRQFAERCLSPVLDGGTLTISRVNAGVVATP
jgi:hypothetical protein